ncbi:MAG: cysteine desulfurase family protein [Bacteroidota bacterium]|nr:cysteine desulfurase family protein [Bacteroidota bacterium]
MKVYLDNAASTAIYPEVIELMHNLMKDTFGNPSSTHDYGRKSKVIIEESRSKIANILNTNPGSIFFTSSGTEGDNMAINSTVLDYNIPHAITSPLSHHAVLYPLQDLANKDKIKLSYVEFDNNGMINLDNLDKLLKENNKSFVSIMHANNEIGTIQPLQDIGRVCKNYNAIFHSDTVQTIGHFQFDMQKVNLDILVASAHKFHGPKGVGFIYINNDLKISPFLKGGGQERNMRSGTENLYGIAGLAKAMELSYRDLEKDMKYIKGLKLYMIENLKKYIPSVDFYGNCLDLENSLYTVLNVSFPEIENTEMLLFNLDIMGIACSSGSACSSGTIKKSHVIESLDPYSNRTSLRFSFSKYNTKSEIDYVVKKLQELFC